MPAAPSPARLEVRISTDLHAMFKSTLGQAEVLCLSQADQQCFAQALQSPPPPAEALERAFARRRQLLRSA